MKNFASFFLLLFLACCSAPQKEEQEITAFYDTIQPKGMRLSAIQEYFTYPKPIGWVSDFDNVFSKEEIGILDSIINNHKQLTTNEIAIVTVPASYYSADSLNEYSLGLFRKWGVGSKEKDNGIGILFCVQNRQARIETGKGLESILTNEKAKAIMDSAMLPCFKNAHYFEGVIKGMTAIISIIGKGN